MFELLARLCVCAAFLGLGVVGLVPLDVAWKTAAGLAALSVAGWRFEAREMKNPGIAGFFGVAESFTVALFLAGAGALDQFGFLALIPCILAGARFSAPMISMAPLAASGLVAANALFSKTGEPSPQVFIHAAGALVISLLLGQRRTIIVEREVSSGDLLPERAPQIVEDGLLQLRENYRRLRDAYNDLERRSRRDKIAARIALVQANEGPKFYTELCAALRELGGVDELGIYTVAQFERVMVIRGISDNFPGELQDKSIEVDLAKAPILIREQAEAALAAIAIDSSPSNTLLIHKGQVIGMVCAFAPSRAKSEDIRKALTEAASFAALAVHEEMERESRTRRLSELELLYEVMSVVSGATTPTLLAGRVARELRQSLHIDGVSVVLLEGADEIVLAQEGAKASLVDCMNFASGQGLAGWRATGSPDLLLFDPRQDQRCDPEETLRRRVGSYALVPLWLGTEAAGYLSASTHVVGGIDVDQASALRLVGAELSRALERLVGATTGGLMTPKEFAVETRNREGALVYLEPLKRDQMIAAYGLPAFENAIRRFAHQVRAMLPAGACLCRRDQSDFVVFLDTDENFARNWANEVSASASFISFAASDSDRRIPLALRAKVARLTSQSDRLLHDIPA